MATSQCEVEFFHARLWRWAPKIYILKKRASAPESFLLDYATYVAVIYSIDVMVAESGVECNERQRAAFAK
jgi:hypothetical protein